MSEGPDPEQQPDPTQPIYGQGQPAQPQPQPGYGPGYGQGYPPPGYGQPFNPAAPYGVHPVTGIPYSDKQKLIVGLLQLLVPLGIGRMMMGQTGLGVAQLLVTIFTCGIGALWPFIDGIVILVSDDVRDSQGRPLRPN